MLIQESTNGIALYEQPQRKINQPEKRYSESGRPPASVSAPMHSQRVAPSERLMTIATRIAERLAALNMSQAELARRAGLAQSTVNGLILGRSRSSSHLHVIARVLGVSTAWLAGETDIATKTPESPTPGVVLLPVFTSFLELGEPVTHVPIGAAWIQSVSRTDGDIIVAPHDADDMRPTIGVGDLLLIDRSTTEIRQHDRIWAMSYGGLPMVRRLRVMPDKCWRLSTDDGAPPIIVEPSDVDLIGRVASVLKRT